MNSSTVFVTRNSFNFMPQPEYAPVELSDSFIDSINKFLNSLTPELRSLIEGDFSNILMIDDNCLSFNFGNGKRVYIEEIDEHPGKFRGRFYHCTYGSSFVWYSLPSQMEELIADFSRKFNF